MKRRRLAVALGLTFLSSVYAAQATMKLKRSLGPDLPLSHCRFSVYTEREDLGALSLPVPRMSCSAKGKEYVWAPSRNAWIRVGC